jgi:hypothetical protein
MRTTRTVSLLEGTNESPLAGDFVISSERDFIVRGVVVGVSTLYNKSSGVSGLVTAVASNRIDAIGVSFKPGDFFQVSLSSSWIVQTDDGPVVDVECNRCGFSYPNKELTGGLCKVCQDQPARS